MLKLLEEKRRRQARASYTDFIQYIDVPGAPVPDNEDDFYPIKLNLSAHHKLKIDALEAVAIGEIKRLMILEPPGCAKSTFGTVCFPPWWLGRNPKKSIISTSYGSDLATKFGRKCRAIVRSREYQEVFGTTVTGDNAAVDNWSLDTGAEYMAAGILAGVTGNRADGLVIDDPMKGREDADSPTIRDKTWEAYLSDLRTRIKPNGWIILILCMTGDTPVLMADGTERPLRDVRRGDLVATHRDGVLTTATVRNWASQGKDFVWKIKTTSGITVKANARHPFLVSQDGELKWIKTKDLRPGQDILRVSGESGREKLANGTGVANQLFVGDIAHHTTTRNAGLMECVRHLVTEILRRGKMRNLNTATALPSAITTPSLKGKGVAVRFAVDHQQMEGVQSNGVTFSASTIAIKHQRFGGSFATIATWLSGVRQRLKFSKRQRHTSDFTLDPIVSIEGVGYEEVFDVQIDGTENFIANGLVSHNTRWHEDDLAGRILPEDYNGETGWITARDGEQWYVLSLQAECEREDDPLGREMGEYIWPEWFSKEHFDQEKITQGPRNWSALYQQRPAPEEGDFFRRDWIRWYDWKPEEKHNGAPAHLKLYGASDYAVTDDDGDWTVHGVGGVDPNDDLYILDWWRKQAASDVWIEAFIDKMQKWETTAWGEESGQILKSLGPFIEKRMREREVYRYRHQFPSLANKAARAQGIRGRMAMGKVYLPRGAPWVEALVNEMMRFTGARGDVDDQVDVLSLFGRMLAGMRGGVEPPKPKKAKKPTYDDVLAAHERKRRNFTPERI